jgi:hypothetical protein
MIIIRLHDHLHIFDFFDRKKKIFFKAFIFFEDQ